MANLVYYITPHIENSCLITTNGLPLASDKQLNILIFNKHSSKGHIKDYHDHDTSMVWVDRFYSLLVPLETSVCKDK